jgi:hypothetical protein
LTQALTGVFRESFPDDDTTGPTALQFLSRTQLTAQVTVKGFQLSRAVASHASDFPVYTLRSALEPVKGVPGKFHLTAEMDRKSRVVQPSDLEQLRTAMTTIDTETTGLHALDRAGVSP